MFNQFGYYVTSLYAHYDEALKICDSSGFTKKSLNNSITKGPKNVLAKAAEIAVAKFIGGQLEQSYTHDLIVDDILFEVKLKCRNFPVMPDYTVNVSCHSAHQLAKTTGNKKILAFCSLNEKTHEIEICGFISVKNFLAKNRLVLKNEPYEKHQPQYKAFCDTYVLPYKELKGPQWFLKFLNDRKSKND